MTVIDHPRPEPGDDPIDPIIRMQPPTAAAPVELRTPDTDPFATGAPPVVDPLAPAEPEPEEDFGEDAVAGPGGPLSRARIAGLVVSWLGVLLVATLVVVYPLGPLLQHRDQHQLLRSFRTQVSDAATATQGLAGVLDKQAPTAPHVGDAVAILDLGPLRVRQVAIEGVGPDQTRRGPGHLPGTAGLGQPGNAVVVGRRDGWGGPFGHLHRLHPGDDLVVTTTQGQSVYEVRTVRDERLRASVTAPSTDDRLTLVTSAHGWPWSTGTATVVVARLVGKPFEPTPQGGRVAGVDGRQGATGGWAGLALVVLAFAGVVVGGAFAHRRWKPLTAYLLTTPALVVLAVVVAEAVSRLLPAWT